MRIQLKSTPNMDLNQRRLLNDRKKRRNRKHDKAWTYACYLCGCMLVEARRVDGHEIDLHQALQPQDVGVVHDMDGLGVTGGVGVDFPVGRVGYVAVGVARLGLDDTADALQIVLGAPEAAGCEVAPEVKLLLKIVKALLKK